MKKHITYFDTLRLIASFFVVFMHTASGALRYHVADHAGWYLLTAITGAAFTAVPLFFMMSGYLLTVSEQTASVSVLLKKRLPKLIVPLLFWSVLLIVYQLWRSESLTVSAFLKNLLICIQMPVNTSYWFLYALIGMYLISPVLCAGLRRLDRKGELLLLALIVLLKLRSIVVTVFPDFAARYLQFHVLNHLEFFDSHLSAFILGWFLGKREKKVSFCLLVPAALLTWGVITLGTFVRSSASGSFEDAFLTQNRGLEVLLAACLFLIVKQMKLPAWWEKFTAFVSPCTFPIYLTHCFCLIVLQSRFEFYSASVVILYAVFVYLVCFGVSFLCGLVPGLRYLALGQKRPLLPVKRTRE